MTPPPRSDVTARRVNGFSVISIDAVIADLNHFCRFCQCGFHDDPESLPRHTRAPEVRRLPSPDHYPEAADGTGFLDRKPPNLRVASGLNQHGSVVGIFNSVTTGGVGEPGGSFRKRGMLGIEIQPHSQYGTNPDPRCRAATARCMPASVLLTQFDPGRDESQEKSKESLSN